MNDLRLQDFQINGWRRAEKSITFAGATPNAIGDFDGTGEAHPIFTVTGTVLMKLFARCSTTLTIVATATLEVGTATNTAGLIAQTAGDAIDAGEIWHDASPDASIELTSVIGEKLVSESVEGLTATANINTGVIDYVCLWKPISKDGNVIAA